MWELDLWRGRGRGTGDTIGFFSDGWLIDIQYDMRYNQKKEKRKKRLPSIICRYLKSRFYEIYMMCVCVCVCMHSIPIGN